MSTINPTVQDEGNGFAKFLTYQGLGQGDDGAPLEFPEYPDKTVSVTGTLAGATVVVEGSPDGVTWSTLTNPQGQNIALDALGETVTIMENPRFTRPRVEGGSGSTDCTASFTCSRSRGFSHNI